MSVPANGNMLLASEDGGYRISRSVRLRSSANAYLSWTPSTTATSTQKLTYSGWIKRGILSTVQHFGLNGAVSAGARDAIRFTTSNALEIFLNEASSSYLATTQLFRDPSAWYHIVVAVDTTQATSSDRIKVYVNGVQITSFSTATYPTQNYNFTGWLVSGKAQNLGRSPEPNYYFDGYMTDINVVDGQQLTPTSFGEFDALTGVWNPIRYTGTYGTNGFYLKFDDTSAFGKDSSGNNNTWTSNNISNIAGTTYDSMVDSPTNYGSDTGAGGEVRGNYCILNPIDNGNSNILLTNGNISVSSSTTWDRGVKGTLGVSSGKYYYEYTHGTVNAGSNPAADIGWTKYTSLVNSYTNGGAGSSDTYLVQGSNGNKNNGGTNTSYGSAFTTGDVEMCAIDLDNGKMYWGKNGTWFNSGNPASGTNAAYTGVSGTFLPLWYWGLSPGTSGVLISNINFGQRPFSYTAPSGFKALCSQNISVPTVLNGANYMAATIWTGTGTNPRTFTGLAFKPDLIWNKSRSNNGYGALWDSVRGGTKALQTYSPTDENTIGDAGGSITSFNSDGATFANGSVNDSWFNSSAVTYVNWQWKASGSTVSNTAGSITSTVNANTTAGFSILTYTGNGTVGATVGHGLGVTPGMVIVKSRSTSQDWPMKILPYMTGGQRLELNTTNASTTEAAGSGSLWNATNPNSTVITLGNQAMTNANGTTYVAYCWAQITGYSAFGSYTGNGSSDGPFVYCGFRPRWVMVKDTVNVTYWILCDSSRNTYNVVDGDLYPNASFAEAADPSFDFLANGFKVRKAGGNFNNSGAATIYAAFAENPFTLARAR